MPKRKRRREKGARRPGGTPARGAPAAGQQVGEPRRGTRLGLWARRSLGWLGTVATLVGLGATALSFFPKFSIAPDPPLDPLDAFTAPWVVNYDGLIPMFIVQTSCVIDVAVYEHRGIATANTFVSEVGRWLWPGDFLVASCANRTWTDGMIGGRKPLAAGVSIVVEYSPAWTLLTRTKSASFEAARQRDGALRWIRLPPKS
jgi:hypothetical protein